MKIEVFESRQVRAFVHSLPPDQRKQLRAGIRGLAENKGEIKPLTDKLTGYRRLRVGSYRVIFLDSSRGGRPVRECIFVERRNIVYEIFQRMALDDLSAS
jgi:mRNA-degrading endonuclease RelE of RelBE toxin-antitoxin system